MKARTKDPPKVMRLNIHRSYSTPMLEASTDLNLRKRAIRPSPLGTSPGRELRSRWEFDYEESEWRRNHG
jgi:hypothetical protein